MTALNEIAPRPGSAKRRLRVGRGEGSGKGKTAGRGVKGQKSRSGVAIGSFEGGQMPLHMRMPKRGFNNPRRARLAEVNLWRLQQAVAAGRIDPKKPVDEAALVAAGLVRRVRDGVRLLGEGKISAALTISVESASAGAKAAVEKAGGSLIVRRAAKSEEATPEGGDKPAAEKKGKTS